MKQLRVLLITRECLRYDSNEGSVLLNLFAGMPVKLANICCKPGEPDAAVSGNCFQLTDRMALANLLHRTPMGRCTAPQPAGATPTAPMETENKRFYDFFRRHNWEIFHLVRECLWQMADIESPGLTRFLQDFAPDVIVAPLCYSRFVLRVQRYVIRQTGCPAVTYIWDDLYSLRQFRLSPLYWLDRFLLRAAIRKTLACCTVAYTMSQPQAEAFRKDLGIPVRVLPKCGGAAVQDTQPHTGVRLLYAGGLYYGRDETLARVADTVRALRAGGLDVRLDIYANSPLPAKTAPRLQDAPASCVHTALPAEQLLAEYAHSDIALHVEAFRKKYALITRLSFSTKIVDCLASGCAVLAICSPQNAGWQYLKAEDAALCVDAPAGVEQAVRRLVCDAGLRQQLREKAEICFQKHHDPEKVRQTLANDLAELLHGAG